VYALRFVWSSTEVTALVKPSAGLLIYRFKGNSVEVFLVHPGGPFWHKKDALSWSIPKGEYTNEDPLAAARREFKEETGFEPPEGRSDNLHPIKQPSGKVISAWAIEGDVDASKAKSNSFTIEWPPRSGRHEQFPEIDKAGWFDLESAKQKIIRGQAGFLEELQKLLSV
jgi:predicted NUDIX family NTP pyrophosphohydrolase